MATAPRLTGADTKPAPAAPAAAVAPEEAAAAADEPPDAAAEPADDAAEATDDAAPCAPLAAGCWDELALEVELALGMVAFSPIGLMPFCSTQRVAIPPSELEKDDSDCSSTQARQSAKSFHWDG